MASKVWALYVGVVRYSSHGITLHPDPRDAYKALCRAVGVPETRVDEVPDDHLPELHEQLRAWADEHDTDWHLEAVETARFTVAPPSWVRLGHKPIEVTHPCLYTHVRPCKEDWPDDREMWCGYCTGAAQAVSLASEGQS